MILVDTSVWIEHLRSGNTELARLLTESAVLGHPWVTGEISLGNLRNRSEVIGLLQRLPRADVASDDEVLHLIEREDLAGAGIGYVDAQLLAATRLTADARLWTLHRKLTMVAVRLGLSIGDPPH